MHKDIRLHGQANDWVEYYVMAVGSDTFQRYFFHVDQDAGQLRIFSPGNEFVISPTGISYLGNGGSFCEYMFGVDQPPTDLAKADITNRLVMYGAQPDNTSGSVRFTERTAGSERYANIFFDGNAVCNYYFFVQSNLLARNLKSQQEELVKLIGKVLKRSEAIGNEQDDTLISEIFPLLKDDSAQIFIIKLINRHHREYRNLFRQLYLSNKKIADNDFNTLTTLASSLQIDRYQQERMRIDVMYRHPDNKGIVDEYRSILLSCNVKGEISSQDNARLTRLKTLSVRNKIPGALFYTLDEMLKRGSNLSTAEEEGYLASTLEILQGIFLQEKQIECRIDREDMLKLIKAKKHAVESRDHSFDQLLLDASKEFDEKIHYGVNPALLEGFSYVITYLDRFDSVANLISQLAFMETVRINDEMLAGLLEHKAAFDNLQEGFFTELFIRELLENAYLGRYGRRKVLSLMKGLAGIEAHKTTIEALLRKLKDIDTEERVSIVLLEHVRDRIRNFYSRFSTKADQEALRREITEELKTKKLIQSDISDQLFNDTIVTIKKEAMYLHTLLPQIIAECNVGLREDFLQNSGLDRFFVEELEQDYYEKNGLDLEELYRIRKGLS